MCSEWVRKVVEGWEGGEGVGGVGILGEEEAERDYGGREG